MLPQAPCGTRDSRYFLLFCFLSIETESNQRGQVSSIVLRH